jgi:hypothetical protein
LRRWRPQPRLPNLRSECDHRFHHNINELHEQPSLFRPIWRGSSISVRTTS